MIFVSRKGDFDQGDNTGTKAQGHEGAKKEKTIGKEVIGKETIDWVRLNAKC